VVDPERLHRILRRITDDLASLRRYAVLDEEVLLADEARLGHTKYLFVTLLEGCIDAAHHVCASEGWGPPDTNADAMRLLARHGALTHERAEVMAAAVGFRNLLVHGYADVDDRRVVAYLQLLGDVEAFVADLIRLIDAGG
jgi:uncharacterized protein YutE (UPF0331/DUF86 family)